MRKAVCVTALILALTCLVYAGEMPNGSPQPPPAPVEQEPTQEPTVEGINDGNEPDSLTETVLDLLARALAAF